MPDKQERRSARRIDCYNRAILDDDIEHGLVVDINNEGAGLLLLKELSLFQNDETKDNPVISGNVHLTIFHPDMSLQEGIGIDAEVIWADYDYSGDQVKIGVRFDDMDIAHIDKLTEWLSKEGNYYFHCELEKR